MQKHHSLCLLLSLLLTCFYFDPSYYILVTTSRPLLSDHGACFEHKILHTSILQGQLLLITSLNLFTIIISSFPSISVVLKVMALTFADANVLILLILNGMLCIF